MLDTPKRLTKDEIAQTRLRRLEAMNLQAIEGNPLDAEDVAMFEMFEREGWSHERRRSYILARAKSLATK
jgi:Fic family protein